MTGARDTEPTVPGTVGEVARTLGVSRRTLHHYDQIGLVSPSARSSAGYRLYSPADIERLRTVVLLRRLEVPLAQVRAALEGGDVTAQLRRQRAALAARRDEIRGLIQLIDTLTEDPVHDHADHDTRAEQLRAAFGDDFDDGLEAAREQWGDSDAWRESARRTAAYGREEWEQIKVETDELRRAFVDAYAAGEPPTNSRARTAVEAHRRHIHRWFYDCDTAMHRQLGELYVSDPRYALGHDEVDDPADLARWIRDAIEAGAGAVRR